MDGAPTVLISQGRIDADALRRSRIGVSDILEAARHQQGLRNLDDIDAAVLETSGGISIIPKAGR
ncbi:YetF domain-containing protein [Paracoccus aestuariivivens]|uniref:YetF domain-containing protein n=1 Tax=Paracoccus aestuariivivens TaxID=1820333 RepID=UPI00248394DE|nr:YetF domain-containing protein [Paracoccus aestuariivivens]